MTDKPEHCEIPHCKKLYIGTNASGDEVFKRGKADVFVKDSRGDLRGVCCAHYADITDRDGTSRMHDLVDDQGGLDPVKVRAWWDSGAQVELPAVQKRAAPPSATKGLAAVLEDLRLPQPATQIPNSPPEEQEGPFLEASDAIPDWFGDRP